MRQSSATFVAALFKHQSAGSSGHTTKKAVYSASLAFFWLMGSFRHSSSGYSSTRGRPYQARQPIDGQAGCEMHIVYQQKMTSLSTMFLILSTVFKITKMAVYNNLSVRRFVDKN